MHISAIVGAVTGAITVITTIAVVATFIASTRTDLNELRRDMERTRELFRFEILGELSRCKDDLAKLEVEIRSKCK